MWFVIVTFVLMVGVTTMWWASVGVIRWISPRRLSARYGAGEKLTAADVAILVAAHNEEMVIEHTVEAACRIVPANQVFIVSDASKDRTVEIARSHGANVLDLEVNRGKAGALVAGLEHFEIAKKFEVVMVLDADSRPADDYLTTGLELFRQPGVVAVAGRAMTWPGAKLTWWGKVLTSYRERMYVATQTLHKFGQAASRINAVVIVPGFASMYRTSILEHIDIAAPGLAIEDYNMTFEVHAKQLGRVAFDPRAARAYTQDPDSLNEYAKQMNRWSLGFWQTVGRHRFQWRFFWVAVGIFSVEVVVSSVLLVVLIPVLLFDQVRAQLAHLGVGWAGDFGLPFDSGLLLIGLLIPDLIVSLYVACASRKLRFIAFAPIFPLLRIVDAWVALRALWRAMFGTSTGVWSSPTRRAQSPEASTHSA